MPALRRGKVWTNLMSRPNAEVIGLSDASLARRIVAAPCVEGVEEGRARLTDWLAEIAHAPAGDALRRVIAETPALDALLTGLAGGSSYLWDLVRASSPRLLALIEAEPERRFADILVDARRAIAATREEAEAMRLLRCMKAESALLIALTDIGGVWPITRVLELRTMLADAAIGAAVDYLLLGAQRRGKLKLADPADTPANSGYIVLAMGKMGAGELNYSSDVDLIVFYDPAALVSGTEPAAFYVRLTRALVKMLQERTADGYVFRVDLRLRPDPASTQIAISTAAALDYYESR